MPGNITMNKVTWGHECLFCHRPILRGKPTIICSVDRPELVGISHATCAQDKGVGGHFWTSPPYHLSAEQLSFLVQFFPRLYALPGWDQPNSALRSCVASILEDYPRSMSAPMKGMDRACERDKDKLKSYRGDLERDFLNVLGQVQRAAREDPLNVEIDLRRS